MAGKSLGTLTIDLVARVGGFVSGMDKAERASAKWAKQVQKDAEATVTAVASVGAAAYAAATAAGVAGFNLLKSTSQQIAETDKWAKSLQISTQELLSWQFAAQKAGVAGDNMADIFKDLSDKIGDAVLNKSGEAVDALDALGLSAEKLSKVSPDKQMLAIGESLGKISTNAGKVTILESLGNDLSKLLPLFDNNNEKLKEFITLAKDYGVAPDPSQIDDLVRVNDLFSDIDTQVKGLKIEIASGLAKADLSPLQKSLDKVRDVLTDPAVLQGLVDLVSEVADLAGWLIDTAAAAGKLLKFQSNKVAAIGGRIDLENEDQIRERISFLQQQMQRGSGGEGFFRDLFGQGDDFKKAAEEIDSLSASLKKLQFKNITPETVNGLLDFGNPVTDVNDYSNNGRTNGKIKPDANGKKLETAFKATETSYLRQISLIDTTGKKVNEVTELQKLQFDLADGKLNGINALQQKRLEQLAAEVDRLNAVKKANQDNLKVAELVANLQAQNSNSREDLNAELIGAGMGDKARERMRERLSITREFLEQERSLQEEYARTGNKSLYDKSVAAVREAKEERLRDLEDYYVKADSMQSNWLNGAKDGFTNWFTDSSDIATSTSNVVSSTMSSALDNVGDALTGNTVSWRSWATSIIAMMAKVALQMAAVNAISGIFGSFSTGGAVGASGGGGTGDMGLSTDFRNFDGGGFTGQGGKFDPAGIVHAGEFVFTKEATDRIGLDTLYAMMNGKGYAEGGLVGAVSASRMPTVNPAGMGAGTNIQVHAPVSVSGGGGGDISTGNTAAAARQIQGIVQDAITQRLKKETSPGGTLYRRIG
ncbi:phage tail tape measure protein [Enterobacterales bacterium CwR94]|nr:phage tail tape measure protein [Enterobacterales bacterium CwR94]